MGCVSDSAYRTAAAAQGKATAVQATVDAAVQVALSLAQIKVQQRILNFQKEIADRQLKLSEEVQTHAENFWPPEKSLLHDAYNTAKAKHQYASASAMWNSIARSALNRGRTYWREEASNRCLNPTRCETARYQRNAAITRVDLMSYSARVQEARVQALNDRRYEQRYYTLGMGKGRLETVSMFMQVSATARNGMNAALTGVVNGAAEAVGWMASNRRVPSQYAATMPNPPSAATGGSPAMPQMQGPNMSTNQQHPSLSMPEYRIGTTSVGPLTPA